MNNFKKLGILKIYKVTIDLNLIAYYINSETYTRFFLFFSLFY